MVSVHWILMKTSTWLIMLVTLSICFRNRPNDIFRVTWSMAQLFMTDLTELYINSQVPLNGRIIFDSKEALQNKIGKQKNNKASNYLMESNRIHNFFEHPIFISLRRLDGYQRSGWKAEPQLWNMQNTTQLWNMLVLEKLRVSS